MQYSALCKGCWQQMHMPIPLRGGFSLPFRVVGIRPSKMNPNICTICEMMFTRMMKARTVTIDATILFADLRGYTKLSQSVPAAEVATLLDDFYDRCAAAIWEHDGLLNKTIGDAVMAIFNFPMAHGDHPRQAVLAAREMQRSFAAQRTRFVGALGAEGDEFGIGVGIHTGEVSFGEFGHSHRDLTAIGTVVNVAARAQSVARPGQIVVTQAVHDQAQAELQGSTARDYTLKGFDQPVALYTA
ncbi:adenylate/guanylate cyclase domain-containing protein [Reyranella sp.]|uniref:adenylate/guanylate cyclase domain-containing protein n=1 Tax=Reyranella sp. TaxID=1929291 RepID=UPI002F9562B2